MDIIEPNITEVPEEITVSACGLINNPTVIEKTSDSFSGDYIAKYTVDGFWLLSLLQVSVSVLLILPATPPDITIPM